MSMFRKASESAITYRIFIWGPAGSRKTSFGLSAPEPAIIDFEHRSGHQRKRFGDEFLSVEPQSFHDGVRALAEVAAGKVPCKTLVVDSLTRPYQALIRKFSTVSTNKDGKESVQTDYVSVNRKMLEITEPMLAVAGINLVAIARQSTRLVREGRDFKRDGVKFVGDERWTYEFDYVLHSVGPTSVVVEKSMSDNLPVGVEIRGDLDFARFVRLANGDESLNARPQSVPAARPATAPQAADCITEAQVRDLEALAKGMSVDRDLLADMIDAVTDGRTMDVTKLRPSEFQVARDRIKARAA